MQRSRRRLRHRYLAVAVVSAATALSSMVPAWAADPGRVIVAGVGQVLGSDVGPTDPTATVNAEVFLNGDPSGLAGYATAVSDPDGPEYRHFLTPAQAIARFGPTSAQTAAVTSWLRAGGLSIITVTPHAVTIQGTVANMDTAFAIQLDDYELPASPIGPARVTGHAPLGPITVASTIAPDVLTVTGLNTTGIRQPTTSAVTATPTDPCPTYYGQDPATDLPDAYGHPAQWAACDVTPKQVRGAYGVTATGLTGKGVTVAVIGAADETNALADANREATAQGEPPLAAGQFTVYAPADAERVANGGECTMDIQAVHAMAPAANIAYVIGPHNGDGHDVLDAITQVVDQHLADVVSGSILTGNLPGLDPLALAPYEQEFQLAAVEGITMDFASGDSGGGLYDGVLHTSYPAASPWVTAVGGTTLAIGANDNYLWETGWANDVTDLSSDGTSWDPAPPGMQGKASTGGPVPTFRQPAYQAGVVPASMAGSPAVRTVPDVAALADPDFGLQYGHTEVDSSGTQSWVTTNGGGTSLATPLFAGIEALIVQEAGPIGFANPALYARYGCGDFHRILDNPVGTANTIAVATPVSPDFVELDTPGQYADSNLTFGPGYNMVTGLGSPTSALIESFRPHL